MQRNTLKGIKIIINGVEYKNEVTLSRIDLENMQDNLSKNIDRIGEQEKLLTATKLNLMAQYGKIQNLLRGLEWWESHWKA